MIGMQLDKLPKQLIGAGGSVLAAIIIASGAHCAARVFEPRFVSEGRHLLNVQHIVEITEDGGACRVILTNSQSVLLSSNPETLSQGFTTHEVSADDCLMLRRALKEYVVKH